MAPNDPHFPTHRATPGLVDRAMLRAERPRPSRAPIVAPALAVAGLLVGLGIGSQFNGDSPAKVVAVAPREAAVERVRVPGTVPVRFVLPATGASTVAVAGSWNDWNPGAAQMVRGDGDVFYTILELPPGEHEYQFVVDGQRWTPDPAAPLAHDDGYGQRNSVLTI